MDEVDTAVLIEAAHILARLSGRRDLSYALAVAADVAENALWDAIDANSGRYGEWVNEVTMDNDTRL